MCFLKIRVSCDVTAVLMGSSLQSLLSQPHILQLLPAALSHYCHSLTSYSYCQQPSVTALTASHLTVTASSLQLQLSQPHILQLLQQPSVTAVTALHLTVTAAAFSYCCHSLTSYSYCCHSLTSYSYCSSLQSLL